MTLINSLKYVICSDLQSNILPFIVRVPFHSSVFQSRKLSLLGKAGVFDKLYVVKNSDRTSFSWRALLIAYLISSQLVKRIL